MLENILTIALLAAACLMPVYALGMVIDCIIEICTSYRKLRTLDWVESAIWCISDRTGEIDKRVKALEAKQASTPRLVSLKPTEDEGKLAGVHTKGGAK